MGWEMAVRECADDEGSWRAQVGHATSDGGVRDTESIAKLADTGIQKIRITTRQLEGAVVLNPSRTTRTHYVNQAPLLYSWKERWFHF